MPEPTTLLGVAASLQKPLDDIYELGKSKFSKNLASGKSIKTLMVYIKELHLFRKLIRFGKSIKK